MKWDLRERHLMQGTPNVVASYDKQGSIKTKIPNWLYFEEKLAYTRIITKYEDICHNFFF